MSFCRRSANFDLLVLYECSFGLCFCIMDHSPVYHIQSTGNRITMQDHNSELINQTTRTRRIAYALILLALALPSLFAWNDNVALESAGEFTALLAAVTLLALVARRWIARHYSAGIQVQVLLAFAFVLISWSGYVSRVSHEERIASAGAPASSISSRIPGQEHQ